MISLQKTGGWGISLLGVPNWDMYYQVRWKTLPGLRGLACSEFRAIETAAPDNEQGVPVSIPGAVERDALLAELEERFASQRFSNNAAAFEAVKSYVLERVAKRP